MAVEIVDRVKKDLTREIVRCLYQISVVQSSYTIDLLISRQSKQASTTFAPRSSHGDITYADFLAVCAFKELVLGIISISRPLPMHNISINGSICEEIL